MVWSCYICSSEGELFIFNKKHYCRKHYLEAVKREPHSIKEFLVFVWLMIKSFFILLFGGNKK